MLRRAGVRTAGVDDTSAIEVEVNGVPRSLAVSIRGGGRDSAAMLPSTRCETATDVVAAFVVSILAPAPAPEPGPPAATESTPKLDAATLQKAVFDEYARRGVQLVLIGRRVEFWRDGSGAFFVKVTAIDYPTCFTTKELGIFDELSSIRLEAVLDTVTGLFPLWHACVAPLREENPKLPSLRAALDDVDWRGQKTTQLGGVEAAAGAGLFVLLAMNHSPNVHLSYALPRDAFLTSASVIALAGGGASFLADDDVKPAVIGITSFSALGALFTSATLYNDGHAPNYTFGSLAAAGYATAGLIAVNAAIHRPPITRLRTARAALDSTQPSEEAVLDAGRDIAHLTTPIPPVVTYAPLVLGGVISTLPAVGRGFDDADCNVVAGVGLAVATVGAIGMFLPEVATEYRTALEEVGISESEFGIGPGDRGGFSISGRF